MNRIMGGRVYEHFQGLVLTLDRLPKTKNKDGSEDTPFLGFGPHDPPFLAAQGKSLVHLVGYPRLFPAWISRLREVSEGYLRNELQRLDLPPDRPVITLFLASTVPGVFTLPELETWITDSVDALRLVMPEAVVLLKPHPMQNMDHLELFLQKCGYENLAISFLHPAVLAKGSGLVIAHHSSTIIDAMALGIPTIQFQDLTPHWLERHPEGSSFLKLGPLWAKNKEELEHQIRTALSDDYSVPDIAPVLLHKMNLEPLLERL
jgi:hypothetical protein